MVKKKALRKLGFVILLIIVLLLVQLLFFGGPTGNIVRDGFDSQYSEGFLLEIEDYSVKNGFLNVDYSLRELADRSHDVDVYYEVYDASSSYGSGSESVVLGERDRADYKLSVRVDDDFPGVGSLLLEAREGDRRSVVIQEVVLDYRGITGNVVGDSRGRVGSYFLIFLIGLAVLFYIVEFGMVRRRNKKLGQGIHDRHLISIHK